MRSLAEKYSILQFNLFVQNFLFSVNSDNEESIHDYRVAAKRIHTLNRLVKSIYHGKEFSQYFEHSGIKRSFKSGGQLREISINIFILQKFEILLKHNFKGFDIFLRREKKHAETELRKTWIFFPYDTFFIFKAELLKYLTKVSPAKFEIGYKQFLNSKVANIKALINSGELDHKLHRARKIIKDIKYGFELDRVKVMDFSGHKMTLHRITVVEDRIGKWHDWLMFSSDLKHFLEEKKNKETLQDLKYNYLFDRAEEKLSGLQKSTSIAITQLFQNIPEQIEQSAG